MEDERLIDEVFKHPFLYDKTDPRHSNKEYVAKAWAEICRELNCNVDCAKKKWSNLRDYFRRQFKDQLTDGISGNTSKRRKWIFFERLSFLIPFMKIPESSFDWSETPAGKMEDMSECSDAEEEQSQAMADDDDVTMPTTSMSPQSSTSDRTSKSVNRSNGASKRDSTRGSLKRKIDEDLAELLKAREPRGAKDSNVDDVDDDDKQFFRSCAPMLKNLSAEQKLEFRIGTQQLLLKLIRSSPDSGSDSKE